ncbi:hypothetical protein [Streptomyces cahuitamycinicus]|uniref:Uncharacterized protein n=1 Tax=Streptomyces cahuitamycinicus TaxID=2070367 RepID=A0A2N8TTX1_9ACTN|nr:hypothetical protein [Streptomyces cahuitamycinicus]PNG22433.1 hypothetical protein C1J00_09515 [Streptomyces cahuitamycinicus]
MATSTTRTRKTATAKAAAEETPGTENEQAAVEPAGDINEEATTAAAEESPAADVGPKAPEAAPLEPPTVDAAPEPPAEPGYVSPTEVIPDDLAEVILDDATKQPPADVEAVFQKVTPYGSTLMCTVRLIERTFLGPHQSPVERLLQPKGAHVSESIAARIRERLVAQAAATDTEK